jgi:uncharacterized protein (DUF302 family)
MRVFWVVSIMIAFATTQAHSSEEVVRVRHLEIEYKTAFDPFTQRLEKLLGRYSEGVGKDLESDPKRAEARLKSMEGAQGLMIFAVYEHGKLLNIYGMHRKAKVYVVGNPLIAATMTRHNLSAALYAPLRVLVREADSGATRVEYDLPSSLFGQFHDREIDAVAHSLDSKLRTVLESAAVSAAP